MVFVSLKGVYMNLSWQFVVRYVKNLFPDNAPVAISDNPDADARVVAHVCSGDVYYINNQINGEKYWQVFVANLKDVELVRYILRSNGLKPKLFRAGMLMSVRVADTQNNPKAQQFMEMVLNHNIDVAERDAVMMRVQNVRQKMTKAKVK